MELIALGLMVIIGIIQSVWNIQLDKKHNKELDDLQKTYYEALRSSMDFMHKENKKYITRNEFINYFVNNNDDFYYWLLTVYPEGTVKEYVRAMKKVRSNGFVPTNKNERRALELYKDFLTGKECVRKK